MNCSTFEDFSEKIGETQTDDLLSLICEAASEQINKGKHSEPDVEFFDIHRHDAVNYTYSGSVIFGGEKFNFVIENGNWNGTVVEDWGGEEVVYERPPQMAHKLEPDTLLIKDEKELERVKALCNDPKLLKLLREYLYDSHFCPTDKIERHYREQFKNNKVRIVAYEID